LGGFVNLKGQYDADKAKGSFGAAKLSAKAKILLAGVAMNALIGLVLLTILALVGLPVLITKDNSGQDQFSVKSDTKIVQQSVAFGNILPGSPADRAGFRGTDIITSLQKGSQTDLVTTPTQLHDATAQFAGQTVTIRYKRAGQARQQDLRLLSSAEVNASQKTANPKGYLGVVPQSLTLQRSGWSAPVTAAGFSGQLCWLTLKGLGHAFGGLGSAIAGILSGNHQARENGQAQAQSQVGGPIAIGKVLWGGGSLGFSFSLMFIAIISLTLALINLLPIPALDGGRLAIILGSRLVLHRPLSQKAEERLVNSGMALVMVLIVLVTIADVNRFF
jgi:regulator of sigma E protease